MGPVKHPPGKALPTFTAEGQPRSLGELRQALAEGTTKLGITRLSLVLGLNDISAGFRDEELVAPSGLSLHAYASALACACELVQDPYPLPELGKTPQKAAQKAASQLATAAEGLLPDQYKAAADDDAHRKAVRLHLYWMLCENAIYQGEI